MAKKPLTNTRGRPPKRDEDEVRFEAWLRDFDSRHADLKAKIDALLYSLGVDPTRTFEHRPV
jgi:hypothetical protein